MIVLRSNCRNWSSAGCVVLILLKHPGLGGQTEVTSDQTILQRTHVLDALELHGLEKASSALFVWTMVWNLSYQRSLRSGTVWSEAASRDFLKKVFVFLLKDFSSVKGQSYRSILIRALSGFWWVDQKRRVQLIATAGPLSKSFEVIYTILCTTIR